MGHVAQSIGKYKAWTTTFGGFSTDPSSVTSRYSLDGKKCSCYINSNAGTSNAATFTITLPFPAANTAIQSCKLRGTDAGVTQDGCLLRTVVNSSTANIYPTGAIGTWTASGNKNAIGEFTYEIA